MDHLWNIKYRDSYEYHDFVKSYIELNKEEFFSKLSLLLENSFDEIHTFIFEKLSTSEDWQQYLIGRPYPDDLKFEFVKKTKETPTISAKRIEV